MPSCVMNWIVLRASESGRTSSIRQAKTVNAACQPMNVPIKTIGQHKVPILLHPEVEVAITIIVARSEDEAARIARGEDVTIAREEEEVASGDALAAADEFFEPEARIAQDATPVEGEPEAKR